MNINGTHGFVGSLLVRYALECCVDFARATVRIQITHNQGGFLYHTHKQGFTPILYAYDGGIVMANSIYDFALETFNENFGDGEKSKNDDGDLTFSLASGTQVIVKNNGNSVKLPEGIEMTYVNEGIASLLITRWIMQHIKS